MLNQFSARKLEVLQGLDRLCEVANQIGARSVAERLHAHVVEKLRDDRFHLVVVGEFNHGKTTLVNALLGQAVLPVGVTPTTTVIHHVVHAATPGARVVRATGEAEVFGVDGIRAFAAGASRADDSVSYLEVQYPAELLQGGVVLVDTPGVNDLSLTRAEITYGYIPRSDAVLFVLDAGQPVKESERLFLATQLIGQSRDKIVFVVNKADIWSAAERTEALRYVRSRLGDLIECPAVFAVSASAALAGQVDASGLPALVDHLTRFLAEERGRILLSNALGEGIGVAGVLIRVVDARRRAARMTATEIAERIQSLERDLAGHASAIEERRLMVRAETGAIKAWARRDLDQFCDDLREQLPAALERASGEDVQQHLGAFLQRAFSSWAQAETAEIASALERLAARTAALLREDAHDVGQRVGEAMGTQLDPPSIEVDTFAYDVGVFAVLSLGLGVVFANALLGGFLLAAAPALALYSRGRAEAEIRRRASEVAPAVLRETAAKVAPKLEAMVDDFQQRLDAWVVAAGEELHRELIEVLGTVRAERAAGSADVEAELGRCEFEAEQVERQLQSLSSLRDCIGAGAQPPGNGTKATGGSA